MGMAPHCTFWEGQRKEAYMKLKGVIKHGKETLVEGSETRTLRKGWVEFCGNYYGIVFEVFDLSLLMKLSFLNIK